MQLNVKGFCGLDNKLRDQHLILILILKSEGPSIKHSVVAFSFDRSRIYEVGICSGVRYYQKWAMGNALQSISVL